MIKSDGKAPNIKSNLIVPVECPTIHFESEDKDVKADPGTRLGNIYKSQPKISMDYTPVSQQDRGYYQLNTFAGSNGFATPNASMWIQSDSGTPVEVTCPAANFVPGQAVYAIFQPTDAEGKPEKIGEGFQIIPASVQADSKVIFDLPTTGPIGGSLVLVRPDENANGTLTLQASSAEISKGGTAFYKLSYERAVASGAVETVSVTVDTNPALSSESGNPITLTYNPESKMWEGTWEGKISDANFKSGNSITAFAKANIVLNSGNETKVAYSNTAPILMTEKKPDRLSSGGSSSGGTTSCTAIPLYRVYNPNSGEHFYTEAKVERDYLVNVGWNDEGIGWYSPKTSSYPVYRLYNPNAGDHHFTMMKEEKDELARIGWKYEGISWYSLPANQGVKVYREYNPNAKMADTHNYTTSKVENDFLVSIGWLDEGIAWWAVKAGK